MHTNGWDRDPAHYPALLLPACEGCKVALLWTGEACPPSTISSEVTTLVLQGQCPALGVSSAGADALLPGRHHQVSPSAEHAGLPAHWAGQDSDCSCAHAQLLQMVP